MTENFYSRNRIWIVFSLSLVFALAVFFSFSNYLVAAIILTFFFSVIWFFLKPIWGIYLMALFLPITGWAISFKFLEIPFIDSLSLIVLISFIIRQIYFHFFSNREDKIKFPLGWAFLTFFVVTLFSAVLNDNIISSIWYSLRWILFFYLAFVVLPFNIIKDKKTLKNVLVLFSIGGFLVALMGVSSLFFQDWSDSFFRVKPLYVLGDWIFGENYNLLAEFLIISSFAVLSLKYWFKDFRSDRLINVLAGFFILVNLLTFGRTAWMTIGLQVILYFGIEFFIIKSKKISLSEILISLFFVIVFISPFFVKMLSLQEANVSSTENRVLLTQISIEAFLEKPFFGHGSGSFVSLVADNVRFVAKYGDPLDSHGFGQKVLAENGIVGALALLLLLFLIFRKLYLGVINNKADYKLLLALLVASFGGYFYQIFNTSYYKGRIWFPIALALIALELISKNKKIEK